MAAGLLLYSIVLVSCFAVLASQGPRSDRGPLKAIVIAPGPKRSKAPA